MKRRNFIKSVTATGAGLIILPSGSLSGQSANNKLNIALIGAHGRGSAHYRYLKNENVVALCDVESNNMALAAKQFPNAKQYKDWRKCLEQKDIDAVLIATPDHHHAFISIWAMNRGKHVFCEKPVADSVFEAREVRKVYLANKNKLATQHGTQRHEKENFDRVAEWVRNGAVGELQVAQIWSEKFHPETHYYPDGGPVPQSLDWDLWIGPARMHPYNPGYFQDRPGSNCQLWDPFDDFGSGNVGDMGSHTMDLAWNAIDADLPTTAEATGDPYNPDVCPSNLHEIFNVPANKWRGNIRLEYIQGAMKYLVETLKPSIPHPTIDISKIGHGAMFKGTKGTIISDFDNRILIPTRAGSDMTYYNSPGKDFVAGPHGDFVIQWINACKGGLKTSCDFDYAGRMIETLLLGLVAHRAGKALDYNAVEGRVTNDTAANDYLRKEYRKGWVLNG